MDNLFYTYSLSGHRQLHAKIMSRFTNVYKRSNEISFFSHLKKLLQTKRVIFGMIDDNYLEFFLITLVRSILQRQTVGIFFRPQTCLNMDIKSISKFFIFYFLSKFKNSKIIIYLPFFCDSRLKYVASDFVMDHEMWHMELYDKENRNLVTNKKKIKKRLLVIGNLSSHKGLKELLFLLENNKSFVECFDITLAGHSSVDSESINLIKKIEGYVVKKINSFVDYSKMCELYNTTDFVWCYYSKKYDQSSGVFGHALQYGKIPLIRHASMLSKMNNIYQLGALTLDDKYFKNYNFDTLIENKNTTSDYSALSIQWRSSYIKKLGLKDTKLNVH